MMLASPLPVTKPSSFENPASEYGAYEQNRLLLKGTYLYLSQIQKGSFGRVTLAVNVKTNIKVAMKAMYKTTREVATMARREMQILQKLGRGNDHICQLVDHFETDEFIVLVLEYCASGDLYDVIQSGSNANPRAVDVWHLANEMYSGIKYAHSLGIYHRDLKPENILFTEKGSVKICDWGLATLSRQSSDFNVGTEKYMAPECFINSPVAATESYDCKFADYWSFGITLLTAVFGTSPFKPVRANDDVWGSADDFRRKNKSVKKSLESDCNFKNFVFYNRPEVLYDIYPTMNKTCFGVFMHLLKVGGIEDDLKNYNHKIEARSLDRFIADLEKNWKYGLTVWEEDELYEQEDDMTNHDSVFDMDDFSTTNKKSESDVDDEEDQYEVEDYKGEGSAVRIPETTGKHQSIPVPSLVESSYQQSYQPKSWYDLEDELDDTEFNKLFASLSTHSVTPMPIEEPSGKAASEEPKSNIHILEKELIVGSECVLNWSDY